MRTLRIFLCLPALALWLTSAAQRQVEDANADWLFSYKEATAKPVKGIPPQAQVGYDDAGWKSVSVPHTWQTYETTGELHPFIASPHAKDNPYWWDGKGFYRKHFTLRPEMRGRKLFIEFDGVMKNCLAYLNGKLIGEHLGGYGCFYFELTDYVDYDGGNLFVLEVSNQQTDPQPGASDGCRMLEFLRRHLPQRASGRHGRRFHSVSGVVQTRRRHARHDRKSFRLRFAGPGAHMGAQRACGTAGRGADHRDRRCGRPGRGSCEHSAEYSAAGDGTL